MIHNYYNKDSVSLASNMLLDKDVIIYPTDTLYGFGADATNDDAINKLNSIKNRIQPYSIIVDSIKMLKKFSDIDKYIEKKLNSIFPGPYTAILNKRKSNLSSLVTLDLNTVGIRIPQSQFILDVVNKLKRPVITTSVNLHGEEPINNLKGLKKHYNHIDIFYSDEKIVSKGSTIIDFTKNPYEVIRYGDGGFKS